MSSGNGKGVYVAGGVLVLCCLVYGVTTVIAMNCAGKGNWKCAQTSGIMACVTGFFGAGIAFLAYRLSKP